MYTQEHVRTPAIQHAHVRGHHQGTPLRTALHVTWKAALWVVIVKREGCVLLHILV